MKNIFKKAIMSISISFLLVFSYGLSTTSAKPLTTAQSPILIAQSTSPATTATEASPDIVSTYEGLIRQFSGILSTMVQAFNYLLWPILILIGGLMDNSLIFGAGIEDRLLLIWTQVRNLINLLFAVFLIGVAIYNVLGMGDDNYALKKILPRMIITLVLVNFSFLGCKLVLDAANVATTAVFALPNSVEQGFSESRFRTIERAMCSNDSSAINFQQESLKELSNTATDKMCQNGSFTDSAKQFFQTYDKNNAALVMAISFGRLPEILNPSELVLKEPSIINLVINLILVLFLEIVYISAFFALFAVLLARIVVSWVIIAVSPIIVLKWGMKDTKIPGLSMLDSFNVDETFIKHAVAPIKIGIGMSIGYIMLDAFQSIGTPSLWFRLGEDFGSVFSGLGSIPELFIGLAAIGIVWKVSFDAANDTFAEAVTNKFKGFMQDMGLGLRDVVLKQAPIVPIAQPGRSFGTFGDVIKESKGLKSSLGKELDKITGADKAKQSGSLGSKTLSKEKLDNILNTKENNYSDKLRNMDKEDTTNYVMNMFTSSNNKRVLDRHTKKELGLLLKSIRDKKVYDNGNGVSLKNIQDLEQLISKKEDLTRGDRGLINSQLHKMVGFDRKSDAEKRNILNDRLNPKSKPQ